MLDSILANLPGVAYRCLNDRAWTMLYVSEGLRDLTGYDGADIIGNARISYNDLIHPDDRRRVWESTQAGLAEGSTYQVEYRVVRVDGSIAWVWEQGRGSVGRRRPGALPGWRCHRCDRQSWPSRSSARAKNAFALWSKRLPSPYCSRPGSLPIRQPGGPRAVRGERGEAAGGQAGARPHPPGLSEPRLGAHDRDRRPALRAGYAVDGAHLGRKAGGGGSVGRLGLVLRGIRGARVHERHHGAAQDRGGPAADPVLGGQRRGRRLLDRRRCSSHLRESIAVPQRGVRRERVAAHERVRSRSEPHPIAMEGDLERAAGAGFPGCGEHPPYEAGTYVPGGSGDQPGEVRLPGLQLRSGPGHQRAQVR